MITNTEEMNEIRSAINESLYGDSRPRMRINGTIENKFGEQSVVGVSVPVGATEDEKKAIFDSIMKASNEIAEFRRLPREKQLEYYLDIAIEALYSIVDKSHYNLVAMSTEDWANPTIKDMMEKISHAGCTADMALCQMPYDSKQKYRGKEI